MTAQARTDRDLSIASPEFVWESGGDTEAQTYLLQPVVAALRAQGAKKILDLGCGNGAFTGRVQREGFDISGLDHSHSGVEIARKHFPRIAFDQYDVNSALPPQYCQGYDAVICVEVIEHLLLPRKLLEAARAALKPNGLLVVTTPFHGYWKNLALAVTGGFDAHWHPLRDYGHIKFFSRATLRALLEECGFNQLQISTAGRIPSLAKSMIIRGIVSR